MMALAASHSSRSASTDLPGPSLNAALMSQAAAVGPTSPLATGNSTPGSTSTSSPLQKYRQQSAAAPWSTINGAEDDSFDRERRFLAEYGGFSANHDFKTDFLVQLRNLTAGAEYHAQMRRELEALRSENARLTKENIQLQAEIKLRRTHPGPIYGLRPSPSASHGYTSESMEAPKSLDVSEKTWDRIISDGF
jgi:hypothetical protein